MIILTDATRPSPMAESVRWLKNEIAHLLRPLALRGPIVLTDDRGNVVPTPCAAPLIGPTITVKLPRRYTVPPPFREDA